MPSTALPRSTIGIKRERTTPPSSQSITPPLPSQIETPSKRTHRRQSSSATSTSFSTTSRTRTTSQSTTTTEGGDEVKIFTSSAVNEANGQTTDDDDIDVDGIDDRLSPVVVEPASPVKTTTDTLNSDTPPSIHPSFPNGYGGLFPYFPMLPYFNGYPPQTPTSTNNSTTNLQGFDKLRSISPGMYPPSMPMGLLGSPTRGNLSNPMFNPHQSLHPSFPYGQQWRPNLFPFGLPFGSGSPRHHHSQHPNLFDGTERSLNTILNNQKPKKPHIKKPLNAFMLFMKEQRPHVIAKCVLKESSQINKVLGQKWKELPRSEQDKYYEMAKEERIRHMKEHPGWSARDNYGIRKKRTQNGLAHKKPREKIQTENGDCVNQKKCRARFGLEQQGQWCKHCKRKKKCTRFTEDGCLSNGDGINGSGNLTGAESSLDEEDEEDEDLNDESRDSNEENKMNLTLTNNHNPIKIEQLPQVHSHLHPLHLSIARPPPQPPLPQHQQLLQPQFFH